MSDNVELNAGSGGDVIAADEVGGVKYQLVQLVKGADGGAKTLINGSDGLPVALAASLPAGANAIGKLAANDGVDVGDVTVNNAVDAGVYVRPGTGVNLDTGNVTIGAALPAGTNLLGRVSASGETGTLYNGVTALTPKFAAIAAASSGDNTLVSAVTSKKIRVLALLAIAADNVALYLKSSGGGVIFGGETNKISLAKHGGFVLPFNPVGWMQTDEGEGLVVNLGGAVAFAGGLVYVEV
jgi:hypothetical protein